MNKLYTIKSNAKRAAVKNLGAHALEGVDYRLVKHGGQWTWKAGGGKSNAAPSPANKTPKRKPAKKTNSESKPAPKVTSAPRKGTKQALLVGMLRRPEGATIGQIVKATGWQRHTARGAISGAVKKKLGLAVTSEKTEGGERTYHIPA